MLLSGFYTIDPEEAGLVLRFGKYVRISEPGLHFKLPLGIETVRKVPIQRQLKEEFGFRTVRAGVQTEYSTKSFLEESSMLTGDLNAATGRVGRAVPHRRPLQVPLPGARACRRRSAT